jgi:hypothetical protein
MRTMPLSQLIYVCSLAAGFAIIAMTVFGATMIAGGS